MEGALGGRRAFRDDFDARSGLWQGSSLKVLVLYWFGRAALSLETTVIMNP